MLINNYPKSQPSNSIGGFIVTSVGLDDVVGGWVVPVSSELQCRTMKACREESVSDLLANRVSRPSLFSLVAQMTTP